MRCSLTMMILPDAAEQLTAKRNHGEAGGFEAALAAREPALFTSASVVRCGGGDPVAFTDLARSMLTEWPEDAPELASSPANDGNDDQVVNDGNDDQVVPPEEAASPS